MDSPNKLNESEITFCELYVNGIAPYAGNAAKCYSDVFGKPIAKSRTMAMDFLAKPEIQAHIEHLESVNAFDAKRKRQYIATHLEQIIEETSTSTYCDRRGNKLSPAALRSVCVQAMKLYAELYPVKEAQAGKLTIEGGEGGVTFNVIVPEPRQEGGK